MISKGIMKIIKGENTEGGVFYRLVLFSQFLIAHVSQPDGTLRPNYKPNCCGPSLFLMLSLTVPEEWVGGGSSSPGLCFQPLPPQQCWRHVCPQPCSNSVHLLSELVFWWGGSIFPPSFSLIPILVFKKVWVRTANILILNYLQLSLR